MPKFCVGAPAIARSRTTAYGPAIGLMMRMPSTTTSSPELLKLWTSSRETNPALAATLMKPVVQ